MENSKYSYRNLDTYKEAKKFVARVYKEMRAFPAEERYALCDQLRRAAISITSNIAEGMSRYSDKEKVHFLEISYASLMEVESQLDVAVELGYITNEKFENIDQDINVVSRLISGLRAKYANKS